MLVQRLTKRLANVLSGLAARLRAAFARLSLGERWHGTETSPRDGELSTQQSGSWLDDAHRLRPRRAALATADQSHGKHTAASDPRPAPHAGTPTPPHPIVPAAPPQEPRPTRPWVFPAHPAPAPISSSQPPSPPQPQSPQPQPAASEASNGDEVQTRRRLISLKYLVRIGLYNEGFAPSAVPEQYQRSLGMDDEE